MTIIIILFHLSVRDQNLSREGRHVCHAMMPRNMHTHTHTCYAEICSTVLYYRGRGTCVPERNIGTVSMDGVVPVLEVGLRLQSTSPLKSSAPSSNMPLYEREREREN